MENQVPQSTASRQPFRKQMAKGDLNPAIWSPTVLAPFHLASLWVVLVGCGVEGSVQGPQ